ncbi:MAG: phosphate ABC transporter permease subunit PstC [Candidatus Coatesbacteria bacterium]|nr:phosphate ABC transporter permease subunit PstC [Candidatus Coatesbacteria bacterium]
MISDRIFRYFLYCSAIIVVLLLVSIFITLLNDSMLSIRHFGIGFVTSKEWDPVKNDLGSFPFLIGTLLTSFLALAITMPFSLGIAIFLGEFYREGFVSTFLKTVIELLAGVPSVIYGFWGLFILVPIIREFQVKFHVTPYGVGIFTSSVILAIMIIPYSASIIREVITLVPNDIKEAAYSLGATQYEVIRYIVIPNSLSGIFAGFLLSLGRALGETMAVTMVIGNSNFIPTSIFSPANTMASVIANEFTEATTDLYLSSLIQIALILFIVTMIINMIGKFVIRKLGYSDKSKKKMK